MNISSNASKKRKLFNESTPSINNRSIALVSFYGKIIELAHIVV